VNAPTGIIDIRGKQYQTVALRIQTFRERHPEHGIETEVLIRDDDCVVMRATIKDATGRVMATGHSEEYRKSSQINRTSALENAETSALGRALAAFGFGGTEFASANEVENAIHQQQGGQSRGDAVSPPAKRAPAHSKLKTELRQFVHEMHGCGDADELGAFLKTAEALRIIRETREKLPHLWDGEDWPEGQDRPGEFVPLCDLIDKRQRECAQATANYMNA
jgi:hypothetical protein